MNFANVVNMWANAKPARTQATDAVGPTGSAQTGGDPFDVLRIRFDRLAVKRTVWPPVNLNSNGPDALKLFVQLFSSLLQRLECDPGSSE